VPHLDGVASQAFNGLTAMYHLLEQKYHARQMKHAESSRAQIRQNSSNLSKPETGSDNNDAAQRQVSATSGASGAHASSSATGAASGAPSSTAHSGHGHGHQPKAGAPVRLMNIEPLAPVVSHHADKQHKDHSNVPIKTFVPTTPYLQPPPLLQQQQHHSQSAHHRQYHNNMPSLDIYLKGGVELPTATSQSSGNENANAAPAGKAAPGHGGVVVPPLNLRVKNMSNATSAAVSAATGNSLFANRAAVPMVSQTARGPGGGAAHPGDEAHAAQHPHSARAPLPTGVIRYGSVFIAVVLTVLGI
jgi:hypothetical protein